MKRTRLSPLEDLFIATRRSGTTSLLQSIAEEKDVYILVPTEEDKKRVGKSAISFNDIEEGRHNENPAKPVLIDNHCLHMLYIAAEQEASAFQKEIDTRDKFIDSVIKQLTDFKYLKRKQ